ncbi:transcription initiation factor TFIID subunit 15-like [Lolium rigidum]|uniref:transcription initiation factor TFIID subunit 15-like n=1 Tax=Lolium rigidum TaxID=89674 RepID=UPI001F5D359E|nr:transcription initiation factor TFIID subunit 15-like [Lolium rigidum]XP_047048124.1 transcription initiation factor TFIID subunit 15-like [Lolium rigidum]
MAGYASRGPPNGSIYVCNLPPGTDETMLAEYFGTIGLLKKDKRTGQPKIWIYRDKVTNEPKGDATVTYEDQHAASAAVEWFNNKDFHGSIIQVHIAVSKNKDTSSDNSMNLSVAADLVEQDELDNGSGRGSGRGDGPAKAWQQDGDWMCPNASCGNVNFAFRGVCNRCGASRPAGVSGSGGGGGRGRGRGSDDARGNSRAPAVGGPPGLFGPNDWPCTMCGNVNWAKRTKCNVCNTSKPGHNEGGVRGGRGGGYKELDEEELEEVRRRRKEAEEDDGEIYDEFGNLKKKFRIKSQQTESAPALPQSGRAGWEVEHRGSTERENRERSRDRGRDAYDERESRNRDRGGHGRERRRSRSRSRDREKERGRDRGRDHGSDRSFERGSERGHDRYR